MIEKSCHGIRLRGLRQAAASSASSLSHSHRRTNRRWNPNVQKVRAIVDGTPRRLHVCTACLKAGKVQKP